MSLLLDALLSAAAACLALTAWTWLRAPILGAMAWRNAARDPRRTAIVIAGLMLGTAILSGSFVTGDSATFGIRSSAMRAFGEVDEIVSVKGDLFFPEWIGDELAADARVRRELEGLSPLVLQDAAVAHPDSGQWEPRAILVGYDPERASGFGEFLDVSGQQRGDRLEQGHVVINEPLALVLDANAGDTIQVRYSVRPDPLIPAVFEKNGTLALASGSQGSYAHSPFDDFELSFPVERGARFVTGVLLWRAAATDLDLELVPPSGREKLNANGSATEPDLPAIVNATPEDGTWTARVHGKNAVQTAYELRVLVFYEVYDLARLSGFLRQAEAEASRRGIDLDRWLEPELQAANFTVAFVAAAQDRGAFLNTPNVFLPVGELQRLIGKDGRINLLVASNLGDPEAGLARTPQSVEALEEALRSLREAHPDEPAVQSLEAQGIKRYWVEQAAGAGSLFASFLTMMGSFSILAGLMLLTNIFFMIAEERKSELGVARAVGLSRAGLVKLFAFEGALYAVAAAAIGAVLGLGISFALLQGVNSAFSERLQLSIPFHPEAASVLGAFAAGVLMTMAVVLAAAGRSSRFNIVRAIRRLEMPEARPRMGVVALGLAMLAAGSGLSVAGFLLPSFALQLLAPSLAILGMAVLSLRLANRGMAAKLAGLGVLAYAFWTIFSLETPTTTEAMVLGPVRAFLMVIGAVLVLVHSRGLLQLSARIFSRVRALRPAVRPAIAYPLHKKLRTGLTAVMFALVITVVVIFSIFFAIFTPRLDEQAGSYDIRASSTLPVDDLEAYAREQGFDLSGVRALDNLVAAEVWGGELVTIDGEGVSYRGPPVDLVYGFGEDFAAHSDLPMLELAPEYATPREAYEAALRHPGLAIISQAYAFGEDGRPGKHHVGATLTMQTREGVSSFTIVGIQKQVYLQGIFLSKAVVKANFDHVRGVYLLQLSPGQDAAALARGMESGMQEIGMDAKSVEDETRQLLEATRRLYSLFEMYLGLGLAIGIASLGIVTARSVLERRQEIGMLRAIGFSRKLVFRSFLLEVIFTATLGILTGVVIGTAVAWGVHWTTLRELGYPFEVPWLDLAIIVVVAYAATVLCTLWPARRAARLPPAEAVRYIE